MSLRARQNGGGKVRQGGGGGRGGGNGSPGGRGNNGGGATPATWDPASKGTNVTLSNGNLTANAANDSQLAKGTIANSSGKKYFEILVGTQNNTAGYIGLAAAAANPNAVPSAPYVSQRGTGVWANAGGVNGTGWTTGNVVGFTIDFSTGACALYVNNVLSGTITLTDLIGQSLVPIIWQFWGPGLTYTFTIRTTTAEFSYSPPTGYTAWVT